MNSKYTKNIRKIISFATLSILVAAGVAASLVPSTVFAAGETYAFIQGDKIQAKGGLYGNGVFNFVKQASVIPGQPSGYVAETELVVNTRTNEKCRVNLMIVESSGGHTLREPPGGTPPVTSSSGTTVTPACSPNNKTLIDNLDKNISVSGSSSNPGRGEDTTETPAQRVITVTAHSKHPASSIPTTTVNVSSSHQNLAPQTINFGSRSSGHTTFNDRDAGRYEICVSPASMLAGGGPSYTTRGGQACRNVTKISGRPLSVEFGSSSQAHNPNGKRVVVNVKIDIPGHANEKTYGPANIDIQQTPANSRIASATTDSNTIGESGKNTPSQTITISASFDDVNPGGYRACIAGTELCSANFVKENNRGSTVEIRVPESSSDQLVGSAAEDESSCRITGIGWLICPVVSFVADLTDGVYESLENMLLKVEPLSTDTGSGNAIYTAWSSMRNVANIAFTLAMLLIIASHLTSIGMSNYNIKRMLPRIIIAAILVNISYWVAAVAVDISNIAGSFSKDWISNAVDGSSLREGADISWADTGSGMWKGIATAVLASSVTLWVGLSALLPILISALAAVVTVFVVLAMRQALIILLIVISPLAFVAFLLPNTEGLFKKWYKLLIVLLAMYPVIGAIFGASQLASVIVMNSSDDMVVQIIGAGISIIPLFITPVVMKTAGGVLNRFAGIVNNAEKGVFDRAKRRAEGYRDYRKGVNNTRRIDRGKRFGAKVRGSNTGKAISRVNERMSTRIRGSGDSKVRQWAANRYDSVSTGVAGSVDNIASVGATGKLTTEQKRANTEAAQKSAAQNYVADQAQRDGYARAIAGPVGNVSRVKAAATAVRNRAFDEDVSDEKMTMTSMSGEELLAEVSNTRSTAARRAAAISQLMQVGKDEHIFKAFDTLGSSLEKAKGEEAEIIKDIQKQMAADIGQRKPISIGAGTMSDLKRGEFIGSFRDSIISRLNNGKLSAQSLAGASADELQAILEVVQKEPDKLNLGALQQLKGEIVKFRNNPQLQGQQPAPEVQGLMDAMRDSIPGEVSMLSTASGQPQQSSSMSGELKINREDQSTSPSPGTGAYRPVGLEAETIPVSTPPMTQQPSGLWTPSSGAAGRPRQRPTAPPPPPANSERPPTPPGDGSGS